MIKKILTIILLLTTSLSLFAAKYTTNIEIKKGEKWWGVYIGGQVKQPFMVPFDTKTNISGAEQTATFLISNTGRYIWSQYPADILFNGTVFIFNSDHEDIKVEKAGKTLREAYLVCCHKNFPPSGELVKSKDIISKPIYDLSLEVGFNNSQQQIEEFAKKLIEQKLPVGTIVIPNGWQSPTNSSMFDDEYYDNPSAMVETLHSLGFKVLLSVSPLIGAYGRNYEAAKRSGTLLCNKAQKPIVMEGNDGYAVCYDIGNEKALGKFSAGLSELLNRHKIDGFKLDCSSIVGKIDSTEKRNAFIKNWNSLAKTSPNNILFTKGTMDGISATAIEPSGNGYNDLKRLVCDATTSPLIGAPYRIPVLPFEMLDDSNDEALSLRALQLMMVMPMSFVYTTPWNIKNPTLKAQATAAFDFRKSIEQYIKDCTEESARSGEPLIRHLAYQFPRSGFLDCDDQFMLGSKYMIAPVIDNKNERTVRLPKGEWLCADGKRYKGPLVRNFDVSNGRMLYFELLGKN